MSRKEINFYVLNSSETFVATLSSGEVGEHTPVLRASVDEKVDSYDVLTLAIPADDENAVHLKEDSVIIFEDIKGWREYIVTSVEDVDGDAIETTVTAELSSIELLDEIIMKDNLVDSKDPERLLEDALEGTRWKVGVVDESLYNSSFTENVKYTNVLEAIDKLSSKYSAEVAFSYTIEGNRIKDRFVNLYKEVGSDNGKRFEVDKDVSEITRTIDITGIKTAIIPFGKEPEEPEEGEPVAERLDITNVEWAVANGDPIDKPLGQAFIGDPEALEKWGKLNPDGTRRHRFMTMEIEADTEEEIATLAWVNLGRYTNPKMTYESTVLDLYALTGDEDYLHEKVALGDRVVIVDNYFTNPVMVQTRIVEMVRDLLDPVSNELVLGDSKQTFKVGDVKQTVEDLLSKVSQATYKANYAQLTGGGIYAYGGSQEPAEPIEGDMWFRPHPTVVGAKQLLRFTGTLWDIELDTSVLDVVEQKANEASNEAQTAKETADGAVKGVQEAISKAEGAVTHTDAEVKRVEDAFTLKLTDKVDGEELTTEITAVKGLLQGKVNSGTFSSFRTQIEGAIQDKVSSTDFQSYQTQTDREINLRVESDDLVNQINISDENILIDGNKLHITALTTIEDAVITSAMIESLTVDQLQAGTIDATYHNVINLTADNITGGDLNMKNVRIMNGEVPVMVVDGATNELTLNVSKMTINAMDVAEEIEATRDHADSVADSALDSAKGYADSTAGETLLTAKEHADNIAKAEADLAEVATKAYTDEKVTAEETRAIVDATAKLSEAKAHAVSQASTAETNAKAHADTVADAEAELALTESMAYADGIVTAEETRAIADAKAVLTDAKLHAQNVADSAETVAKTHADNVATAKADLAVVEAKAYADGIVTAEEERAIVDAKAILAEAKIHANAVAQTESTEALTDAKAHTDTKAGTTLTTAKEYADTVAQAKTDLALVEANAYADGIVTAEESRAIAEAEANLTIAQDYATGKATTAETNAKSHADSVAKAEADTAEANAKLHADNVADAEANLALVEAKAYADDIITAEETRAIEDAKAVLADAKAHAVIVADKAETDAKTHANSKATTAETNAKAHADTVAKAQADLAEVEAKAHADTIVTAEEKRAIADATAKLATAKTHAQNVANTAETDAKAHADTVALAKANLAETEAKAYADNVVTAEETRAIADATAKLTEAKNHANSKASTAETNAKNHANSKATTAETNAKAHADAVAKAKADVAEAEAKAYADGIVTAEETRAIADAKAKLTTAQNYAKEQSDLAEASAKTHATTVAEAEADLALTTAKAYADGIISDEEERAIADAQGVLAQAKAHANTVADKAEADAKTHANSKATTAEANAKAHADNVALAKANLAETEARAYADGIVSTEEKRAIADANAKLTTAKNYAKAEADSAETTAKTHADSKANTAETNAKKYAEDQVSNVKIGGVNLIDNGDFAEGLDEWETSGEGVTVDANVLDYPILRLTNTFGGGSIEAVQFVDVLPNTEYTFSFKNTRNAQAFLVELKEDGTATANYRDSRWNVNGSYTHYSKTITTMSDTGQFRVILRGPAGHNPFFYEVQLEEGNKATAYSKSENDRIKSLDKGLSTKADQDTVDGISTELSDFQTVTATAEELGEVVASLNEYRAMLENNEVSLEQASKDITTLLSRTDAVTNNLGEMSESWGFVDAYMTVADEGLIIGEQNGNTAIRITNDRIDFMDGSGEPVAFITNQVMQINRGIFVQSLTVGEHKVETIEGGHTIFTWVP